MYFRWPARYGLSALSHKVMGQIKRFSAVPANSLDVEVNRIVWLDLEMTGLDIETDKIMEVACLITDANLNVIATHPEIIINQSAEVLENMNDWCKKQHGSSGLTEACLKSTVSVDAAERQLLDFIKGYVTEKFSPLAGNSVYMDRLFLRKYMPQVDDYLHYRIIDVSTVKELCRRWNPEIYKNAPKKQFSHRSLADIIESVNELKYYKDNFLNISAK